MQEVLPSVDRLGERREVWIERAVGDLLEQQKLGVGVWRGRGPDGLLASLGGVRVVMKVRMAAGVGDE